MPSGDNIVFSMERTLTQGPVERDHLARLDGLRPHLARSALISARLGMQRAEGATDALTALRLPALVLDDAGRVVEANELIQDMADRIGFGAGDRLVLPDRAANEILADRLAALGTHGGAQSCSLPLRDNLGQPVGVLHVLPVRRAAHDIFGRGFALLVLTPIGTDRSPSADLMRSLSGPRSVGCSKRPAARVRPRWRPCWRDWRSDRTDPATSGRGSHGFASSIWMTTTPVRPARLLAREVQGFRA